MNDSHKTNYIGVRDDGSFIEAKSDELSNTLSYSSNFISVYKGGLSAAAGLCAESVFDTAVTSGMGYVFTTPMSIAAGVTNPYLTPNQKTGVVIMKTLEAVVGMLPYLNFGILLVGQQSVYL